MHNLGLIAAAVIVIGLIIFLRQIIRAFRELVSSHLIDVNTAHNKFLRKLDKQARQHANTTQEPFATIVLDQIDQHLDEVAEIKDQAADKNAKAAKKGKP